MLDSTNFIVLYFPSDFLHDFSRFKIFPPLIPQLIPQFIPQLIPQFINQLSLRELVS